MKIAIASDHAGFQLKKIIIEYLKNLGYEVMDLGTNSDKKPVDYPDFSAKVAKAVINKKAERGILICGSGVGASVTANKFKGIKAAICHDSYSARQGVEHDDMNILCMGGRIIGSELAKDIVSNFVNAVFSNEERHLRRLNKIKKIEGK